MILYFSGTGNNRYAAQAIARATGDGLVSMNERIKGGDTGALRSPSPYVFVTPTYGWRIPRVVEHWMGQTRFEGSRRAYFVMTCGDGTGNAAGYLKKLCAQKNLEYMGLMPVVMPENYIAMFAVPDQAHAAQIIARARPAIDAAVRHIGARQPLPPLKVSPAGRIQSRIVNPLFYAAIVSARGFRATDACVGCGDCAARCALNNIAIRQGKPVWGGRCTHCMACICGCPHQAVEYKNASRGKPRYFCTDEPE